MIKGDTTCSLKLIRTTGLLYPGGTQSYCLDLTTKLFRGKDKVSFLRKRHSIQEEWAVTNSCKLKTTGAAEPVSWSSQVGTAG